MDACTPTTPSWSHWRTRRAPRPQERVDTAALERLLPLIAGAALGAEDPASLTPRHCRQLVGLGQAAADYLAALVQQTGAALVRRARGAGGAKGRGQRQ